MTIQVTATIQGHPWDLWGLSKLFDGSNASHTLVKAAKPEGRPTFDTNDAAAVARFRAQGYDVLATITSDELVWDELSKGIDLRDLVAAAELLVARTNGVALLLDPEYRPAKLQYLSYQAADRQGSVLHSDWTPNKDATRLELNRSICPLLRMHYRSPLAIRPCNSCWRPLRYHARGHRCGSFTKRSPIVLAVNTSLMASTSFPKVTLKIFAMQRITTGLSLRVCAMLRSLGPEFSYPSNRPIRSSTHWPFDGWHR